MIRDFSTAPEPGVIEADICIVGAGAAGITLATELAGHRARVVLVESGGFEFDTETQGLYEGELGGMEYWPLAACRLRFFGGTTNHWTGRCQPLTPWDFEPRPWTGLSGWPIRRGDLDDFYLRARPYFELAGENWFDPARFAPEQLQALPTDPQRLETRIAQWSPPTRFGQRYRSAIADSPNVDILLYANATAVETSEDASHVTGLRIASLAGGSAVVRARQVVLACGGIENARILLLSDAVESGGLGNRHGMVGRCFMEHAHLLSAFGVFTGDFHQIAQYSGFNIGDASLAPTLALTPAAKQAHRINDYIGALEFDIDPEAGYPSLTRLIRGGSDDHLADVWNVITDLDNAAMSALERLRGRTPLRQLASNTLGIFSISEQEPNPDSRVLLTDARDALGQRTVRLDWRLSETDKRTMRMGNELVGMELGRLGLGRIKLKGWLAADHDRWGAGLWGGNHHMGTTRMSEDPRLGVVDRDCRVHGIDNLFVAGSSVFATGGAGNPTLTIVALAIRLADHLKTIA